MKSILVAITISIAVFGIVGISYFTDFDANQVPTGFLDTVPVEKTVLDSFDKPSINLISEQKESSSVEVLV